MFAFFQTVEDLNPLGAVNAIKEENPLAWIVVVLLIVVVTVLYRLYLAEKNEHNTTKHEYLNFTKEQIQVTLNALNSTVNSFDKVFDSLSSINKNTEGAAMWYQEMKLKFDALYEDLKAMKNSVSR